MHIVIAFSTITMPAFFMAERFLLGMHKDQPVIDSEQGIAQHEKISSIADASPMSQGIECNYTSASKAALNYEDEMSEYRGKLNMLRYIFLRLCILLLLVVMSVFLRDHFLDLVDFTTARGDVVFWTQLPVYERAGAVMIITVCTILGVYVMYYAGKNLFSPDSNGATFPYCSEEYQSDPYYMRNTTFN
ncbi:Amino Acid/Auxin Permease [Phytophthora megakarya]|uniref:Amino Acid/Auxin Permease n=1 Tax=Phytophthora megakarya TaxID=4795 RepID=A0A225UBY5_9STRA|nr:Amino Acid/Auxin Permease [Phytophthora megakarya]